MSVDAQAGASAETGRKEPMRPSRWQLVNASPWMKGVRLTAFATAVAAVGVGVTYTRVRGQVGEQMISVGESLMRYERADRQDAPRELRLNGQSLMVTSGTSPDDVSVVLDEFEARCRAHNADLQAQIRAASAQDFFVMREERGETGAVGCLDFGEEISAAELLGRAARFRESNDLHDLGDLRYVYARTLDEGHGTHFLTFWTTGSLDFDEITGHGGNQDVPGADVPGIPRPPRSRRIIDAYETGANQRVVSYAGSSMTEWELEAFYREALPRAGYHVVTAPPDAPPTHMDAILLAAERDQRMTFVVLDTDRHGHGLASVLTGE
ncbi:MAG: hypothetical protein K1X94_04080 [Sandaracinaceae bacterium]|nr:hypothetical protein [Sandaracinaceae bacterium]